MLDKVFVVLVLVLFTQYSSAHSGRTDSSGGHNCSEKSQKKGLCSGYHYHASGDIFEDGSDDPVRLSDINGIKVRHLHDEHEKIEWLGVTLPDLNVIFSLTRYRQHPK